METADIINGGISLAISLICVLVATGVIPLGKTKEESDEKLQTLGWLFWLVAAWTAFSGIVKMFGIMR